MPESALSLSGIVKSWGPTAVLRGADLELEAGQRAFLGGKNGAGKTTLLRVAAGVLEPTAGSARLYDLDPVRDRREYQSILGYLPAGNGGLYARLTTEQNLDFWAGLGLLPTRERAAAVAGALERFELGDLAGRRVDRMSMGQRQRVRLATTFLHSPRVVLLDEPATSLDDDALALLGDALADHHARGGASVWCAPTAPPDASGVDVAWRIADGVVVPA